MKRFYKDVSLCPVEGGYGVVLDGRPVKLPGGSAVLCVAHKALADLVAAEWAAQGDVIVPDEMPVMQIVSTCALEVGAQRPAMEAQIFKYIDTDLLYYRAPGPDALVRAQQAVWDPLLAAFSKRFGVDADVTDGLVALRQGEALHAAVRGYVSGLSDEEFTVLQIVVPLSGSVVLGCLFTAADVGAVDVLAAARVEERFKDEMYDAERYGPDPAIEKADIAMMRDLQACGLYLRSWAL